MSEFLPPSEPTPLMAEPAYGGDSLAPDAPKGRKSMNFSEEASYVKSLYGKADGAPTVPEVPRSLAFTYDETPFLKISCSYCHQSQETISDDPAVGAFRHCNMVEEPPKELIEKLVKYQIK